MKTPQRRLFLIAGGALLLLGSGIALVNRKRTLARAGNYVKPELIYQQNDLTNFLSKLPNSELLYLKKELKIAEEGDDEKALLGPSEDAQAIDTKISKISTISIANYQPFTDSSNYHATVSWAAEKSGISKDIISVGSTFLLEHLIQEKILENIWKQLPETEKSEILSELGYELATNSIPADINKKIPASINKKSNYEKIYQKSSGFIAARKPIKIPTRFLTRAVGLAATQLTPVGWALDSLYIVNIAWGFIGPNFKKTIHIVNEIHRVKINALQASGISMDAIEKRLEKGMQSTAARPS